MRLIDLTNNRYGKLRVVSRAVGKKWHCVCDCGKSTVVFSFNLKSGNTLSCGCLNDHHRLKDSLASKHALFDNYRRGSVKRGIPFGLSFDEFIGLTQKSCHYCGDQPGQFSKSSTARDGFIYNGLDRVDSDRGYEIANVVPCCKICNRAKWDMGKDEFLSWLDRCYRSLESKGYYAGD